MSSRGSLEKEIKFADVQLDQLRDRLADLEAERVGPPGFEDNWLLDRDEDLEKSGCALRLRTDSGGARLTFKGPMHFEGRLKVRTEHDFKVEDAESARALFAALGYEPVRRYQKVRETWELGGVTIVLDHTPIGDFAEFEGEGAETVARRCGFDLEQSERRTYLRLYEDHRQENPDLPEDMVFPET